MPDVRPEVKPVKLICAVMLAPSANLKSIDSALISRFGAIDLRSDKFDFSFTDYYRKEMGSNLTKQFYSFDNLIAPDQLSAIKNKTIEIEAQHAVGGRRTVNIDPGYIEESKLVLASTKNFSHRIYLGRNIWGEITLRFIKGEFVDHPWTYPDYMTPTALGFFKKARGRYREQLSSR